MAGRTALFRWVLNRDCEFVMADKRRQAGKKRFIPAMLVAAGLAVAIPGASMAVGNAETAVIARPELAGLPFTPANVDPALAQKVAALVGVDGLRFTPASKSVRKDRTVTVAVRVDEATARAISVRHAVAVASGEQRVAAAPVAIAPTRYNLGIARGYQSFAQPKQTVLPAGVRDLSVPDLSEFKPAGPTAAKKPSRLQPRIAVEKDTPAGRAPSTLELLGEQRLDVGGSYRVLRNLDVTAGVRLSQQRDRLDPLTTGAEDSQAVYVGTQIRF